MKTMEIIYKNVKDYCKLNNATLCSIEKRLGKTSGYLSRLANKDRSIELYDLLEIIKICNPGCSVDEFISNPNVFENMLIESKRNEIENKIAELQAELEKLG